MFNTELTTYKTGGGTLSDKSTHPGEYVRVSAWIKKIKNDLVLIFLDLTEAFRKGPLGWRERRWVV
jgi:hypothetical protein